MPIHVFIFILFLYFYSLIGSWNQQNIDLSRSLELHMKAAPVLNGCYNSAGIEV